MGEFALEPFEILALASANIDYEDVVSVAFARLVVSRNIPVEDALLHWKPFSKDGPAASSGCHEGIEIFERFGVFLDVVVEVKFGVHRELERCVLGVRGNLVAILFEVGGKIMENLQGMSGTVERVSPSLQY